MIARKKFEGGVEDGAEEGALLFSVLMDGFGDNA